MIENNKVHQPVIIIAIAILILFLISFQSSDIKIGNLVIRKLDLLSDIRADN
ncbi:MAG: hypothetical protein NTX22_00905 [Ignavibacteriales bacterium]|nr:hypothetical protein [Ignavibacteriales bacterium]